MAGSVKQITSETASIIKISVETISNNKFLSIFAWPMYNRDQHLDLVTKCIKLINNISYIYVVEGKEII